MFCRDQLAKVEAGRKPDYELDVCDKLLRILEFICTNKRKEILEQELSMMILDGSKRILKIITEREYAKCFFEIPGFSELLEGIDDTRNGRKSFWKSFRFIPIRHIFI